MELRAYQMGPPDHLGVGIVYIVCPCMYALSNCHLFTLSVHVVLMHLKKLHLHIRTGSIKEDAVFSPVIKQATVSIITEYHNGWD